MSHYLILRSVIKLAHHSLSNEIISIDPFFTFSGEGIFFKRINSSMATISRSRLHPAAACTSLFFMIMYLAQQCKTNFTFLNIFVNAKNCRKSIRYCMFLQWAIFVTLPPTPSLTKRGGEGSTTS